MTLSDADISRIVEMAWEDRTPFEAIKVQFGLNESGVVALMRSHMKASSFRMWRKRTAGRVTKHAVLRGATFLRHRATHTRRWCHPSAVASVRHLVILLGDQFDAESSALQDFDPLQDCVWMAEVGEEANGGARLVPCGVCRRSGMGRTTQYTGHVPVWRRWPVGQQALCG